MTFVKRAVLITGPQTREKMRKEIWTFHNFVNKSTGTEEKSVEILTEHYGSKARNELLLEAQVLIDEIKVVWEPLVHSQVNGKAFLEWKRALNLLIAVLKGGPN